jgi:hypothetical protein
VSNRRRLQAEGNAFDPSREQVGTDSAEQQHGEGIQDDEATVDGELAGDVGLEDAHADFADDVARWREDRRDAARRSTQAPDVDADVGLAVAREQAFLEPLSDECGVRMRHPDAVPVGDDHVGGPRRAPQSFGEHLDRAVGVALFGGRDDLRIAGSGLGDAQGTELILLLEGLAVDLRVEVCAGAHRQDQDGEHSHEDLGRQRPGLPLP